MNGSFYEGNAVLFSFRELCQYLLSMLFTVSKWEKHNSRAYAIFLYDFIDGIVTGLCFGDVSRQPEGCYEDIPVD